MTIGLLAGLLGLTALAMQPVPLPMPVNGDFSEAEAGRPAGWEVNRRDGGDPGVAFTQVAEAGRLAPAGIGAGQAVRLVQRIDAAPWRGKVVRLSARVRVIDPGEHVGLRLSVERPEPLLGFYDQMEEAPISAGDWRPVSLVGVVEDDATLIQIGATIRGRAEIEIDDVTLSEVAAGEAPPSAEARAYLDRAIAYIRGKHMDGPRLDWERITARAYRHAAGAVTSADTYPAIRGVLSALGDNHSFLEGPPQSAPAAGGPAAPEPPQRLPGYVLVDGRFGVLTLPGLDMVRPEHVPRGRLYVGRLREGLAALDRPDLCGWIVDVRGNPGGNMWPMLNGLTPLLGRPPFGAFVELSGARSAWTLDRGQVTIEGTAPRDLDLDFPAFRNGRAGAPVAVLIGPGTASSGEAVAIAFAGRPGSRSFGTRSAGYTSANETEILSDGAIIGVPSAWEADRTGREYRAAITPDALIEDGGEAGAAMTWLDGQCRAGDGG